MDIEFEKEWKELILNLEKRFGGGLEMEGIMFLIGVQELGKGYREFTKQEKMDIMHIATCTILSQYGYYIYEGRDKEGWPHWKLDKKLPPLSRKEQERLLKQAVIDYLKDNATFQG